jgi:DNA-binding GntR family transcriptional regulator
VKTLSQQHGVSHITAEKAMGILKAEGLVRTQVGKGASVTK